MANVPFITQEVQREFNDDYTLVSAEGLEFLMELKFVAESFKIKTSHFLTCTLSWNGFAEQMVQTAKKLICRLSNHGGSF